MQAPLLVRISVGSRIAFDIGECSGEDDDDPNVATSGGVHHRMGPQRHDGGAPLMGGVVARAVAEHVHGSMAVGRAAWLQGCRVMSVPLSP
jgi:hypothetical protein